MFLNIKNNKCFSELRSLKKAPEWTKTNEIQCLDEIENCLSTCVVVEITDNNLKLLTFISQVTYAKWYM